MKERVKKKDKIDTWDECSRLRNANSRIDEFASQLPPLSPAQLHTLISGKRQTQFQMRRQSDRYLFTISILTLILMASILWHLSAERFSLFNIIVILSIIDLCIAIRAGASLFLMWQTHRLRQHPYRMSRYADLLNRLTYHRRHWVDFVLHNSYGDTTDNRISKLEFINIRIPSYAIAACLLLLIAMNSDKAFAKTRDYAKVTTTSEKTDDTICNSVDYIIDQL